MNAFSNKEINKVKLTLTTECNLSCPYCFVNKTGRDMGLDVAKNAVDMLIGSEGRDKLLSLYGGEPLLKFNLIGKVYHYAANQSKKNNKRLTISICTNATLLNQTNLDFFKKHDIKIILSMGGNKEHHNSVRTFENGCGTYDLILEKLPLLFKTIKKSNLGVSFCILPEMAAGMVDNFIHLLELGFRYINFEIIRDYHSWSKEHVSLFHSNYLKIIKYILLEIDKGNFIFINPINWEIKHGLISGFKGVHCPFNYLLEVYPDGEMAFSPFLLNLKNKEEFVICNPKSMKPNKFYQCVFVKNKGPCLKCANNYFKSYCSDEGANKITRIYRDLSLKTAEYILKKAEDNRNYEDYVAKIKREICF